MSMQDAVRELRAIKNQLKRTDSYFDRDQHSLTSVVTLPTPTLLSGALEEYTQYVITTDGDIRTITYQVKSKRASEFGPEIEAKDLAYIPGPVQDIRFGNDTVQTGKNINLIKYNISRLAPPMVPPSPPGTQSDIVDPHVLAGLARGIEVPLEVSLRKGAGVPFPLTCVMSGVNEHDAFDFPVATAYQVTTGKILIIFAGVFRTSAVAKGLGLEYADTAVDDNATAGTNAVALHQATSWLASAADQTLVMEGLYGEIPAGKYGGIITGSTSGALTGTFIGVEVDA